MRSSCNLRSIEQSPSIGTHTTCSSHQRVCSVPAPSGRRPRSILWSTESRGYRIRSVFGASHHLKSRQCGNLDLFRHQNGTSKVANASSDGLSTAGSPVQPIEPQPSNKSFIKILAAAAALVGLIGTVWLLNKDGSLQSLKVSANQSILGRSGFLAAFSLIFISEIGDKTFFIAGLLAAKVGRWRSLIGSSTALGLMTVISVGIGAAFKSLPDVMKSSLPIGQYLGAAFMFLFGVRTIKEAWQTQSNSEDPEDGELHEAQVSVQTAEKEWSKQSNLWQTLLQVGTLIFLAEWGDRSMLATIALGASHPPVGVAVGATLAHVAATAIAVVSGAIASQYVSEKTIGYIGGVLFLLFAFLTLFGYF